MITSDDLHTPEDDMDLAKRGEERDRRSKEPEGDPLPDYRIATDGESYRIERLRPRWFGICGPLVWRRLFRPCYYRHIGEARRDLEMMLRKREGWKAWTPPQRPATPPPLPPPFPANRLIREGDRPRRSAS